ncbi:hypothetical protein BDF19DRAFT_497020 [Syncephalis fuscata]|nr:hypothetical protein BDF19DRAFT_497020 [Syncephalis fuscata]
MANKTFEVAEKLQAVNFVGYFDQPDSLFQNMSKPVITEIAYNLTGQNWTSSVRLPNDYGTFAISRKEFDVLSKVGITGKQLYDIGSYYYMAYTIFSIECLGRTRTANGEAWYLKVKSSVWESVRKEVASVYLKAGGNEGAFDQNDFYPHITIGQTGNEDIPDEDIARGTNSTCVANVKLVGPPF